MLAESYKSWFASFPGSSLLFRQCTAGLPELTAVRKMLRSRTREHEKGQVGLAGGKGGGARKGPVVPQSGQIAGTAYMLQQVPTCLFCALMLPAWYDRSVLSPQEAPVTIAGRSMRRLFFSFRCSLNESNNYHTADFYHTNLLVS